MCQYFLILNQFLVFIEEFSMNFQNLLLIFLEYIKMELISKMPLTLSQLYQALPLSTFKRRTVKMIQNNLVQGNFYIKGEKPVYGGQGKLRDTCSHLKCQCKNKKTNPQQKMRFSYLTRSKRSQKQEACYTRFRTQMSETQNCSPRPALITTTRTKKLNRNLLKTEVLTTKTGEIQDKKMLTIYRQIRQIVYLKYGKKGEEIEVRELIGQYIQQNIHSKEPLKNIQQLFQKVQELLQQKFEGGYSKKENKKQKSEKPLDSQIYQKNKKTFNVRSIRAQDQYEKITKQQKDIDVKNVTKKKNLTADQINLLLNQTKRQLINEFLKLMVNSNIKIFQDNLKNIQSILEEDPVQSKQFKRKNLHFIVEKLKQKLKKSGNSQELKARKYKQLEKLLAGNFQTKWSKKIYRKSPLLQKSIEKKKIAIKKKKNVGFKNYEQNCQNSPSSKQKSKSSFQSSQSQISPITTTSQIGKSLRTRKTIKKTRSNSLIFGEDLFLEQRLVEADVQQLASLNPFSLCPPKKTLKSIQVIHMEDRQNLELKVEKKDRRKVQTQKLIQKFNKQKHSSGLKKQKNYQCQFTGNKQKLFQNSQKLFQEAPQLSSQQYECNTSKQVEKAKFCKRFSLFKNQNNLNLNSQKQKYNKTSISINKLMDENKQIIEKGRSSLRECQEQPLIIQQTDSVLIKKKKIRGIKQKVSQFGIAKNPITDDLLAYTNVYELACELMVQKKTDEKSVIQSQAEVEQLQLGQIVNKAMISQQLKFINLSNGYEYGKYDDDDIDFKYKANENNWILEEFKPAKKIQLQRLKFIQYKPKSDEILGQKQLLEKCQAQNMHKIRLK